MLYKALILSDLQIPWQDDRALKVVEKYMAAERWDELVWIGDFLDLDFWGKFNVDLVRKLEGRRLLGDVGIANAILDRHQRIVRARNKKAKFVMMASNHGVRAEKFVDKFPALEGLIEEENVLNLKERGIKYVRCYPDGDVHRIGKRLLVTHGMYAGGNATRKHVDMFGENIVHGHTHAIEQSAKARLGSSITGTSIGCLCVLNMSYVGKNPTAWSHGICTVYVKPDGDHTLYTSAIKNYSFVAPGGRLYRA